jgi:UDP-N-acetylmuramate dehydrogenase
MAKGDIQKFSLELWNKFPGQVKLNEPLKNHTSYKVGGPAVAFCQPDTKQVLQEMIKLCSEEELPFYILGSGSNVLIHDSGLSMVVINLEQCCTDLYHKGKVLYAGSGIQMDHLVQYCQTENLGGLDFMSGIPGTVGGALRMNAGAFEGEIGDCVHMIDAMTNKGEFIQVSVDDAGFGYRKAENLQDKILLGCSLHMSNGCGKDLERSREQYLKRRAEKQPLEYSSCGSVFKRPPGHYAGTLIENAGCKGMQIGGAMVSQKHANFIINYNDAKASDIYKLFCLVQKKVYEKFQVWLDLEVKLVGFPKEEEKAVRNPYE